MLPRRKKPRMHASLKQVAELAGVAPVTVSRVLNSPGQVAPATRAKVQRAMERLGYVPDLVASSLASRRSRIVALLVPTLSHPMVDAAIQGLTSVLRPINYHVIIGETGYEDPNPFSFIMAMLGRRPEALVVVGPVRDPKARKLLKASRIPVVQIWDLPEGAPIGIAIGFRNADAAYAMVKHLIARGYSRIGFFGGIDDERVRQRRDAFLRCLADHRLQPSFHHTLRQFDPFYDVTDDFLRLIDAYPETDAVFCDTDMTAQTILFACQRHGLRVPERVAIAGFGDFPISSRFMPSLTTVRIHPHAMGRRAGEVIVGHIRGTPAGPVCEDIGFEVIPRESA